MTLLSLEQSLLSQVSSSLSQELTKIVASEFLLTLLSLLFTPLVTLVYSVYNDRFLPVKFEIFFNFFPRKSQLWTFCSEINEQDNVQIWTQIESNSMTFARQVLLDIEHKVVSSTPRLIRWTQIQSYVERWTASRFLSHDQRASRLGFFNHYSLF
jgi:hypothetical protein